jgi:hypothetical protein
MIILKITAEDNQNRKKKNSDQAGKTVQKTKFRKQISTSTWRIIFFLWLPRFCAEIWCVD